MAVRGFDQLIDFLLEEITLCGTNGANTTDFKRFVDKFYSSEDDGSTDELELIPNSRPKSLVDDRFYEKLWKWLIAHPGAHLGHDDDFRDLSLAALTDWENQGIAPVGETRKDKRKAKVAARDTTGTTINKDAASQAPRIHVSEDRIWKALTGHAKDLKRVPPFEFELLSYIAFAGPEGIIQPFLIERSGQDKRSVPKRTDNLHAKGYIEKRGILSSERNLRTSLLVLKKFSKQAYTGKRTSYRGSSRVFEHGSLDYDRFLDYMVEAFEKSSDIITVSDLYKDLEVYGNDAKWQRGAVFRAMKRMCEIGVAEKLKARDQYNANRFYRSIRLLRPPTNRDREAFSTFVNRSYFGIPSQTNPESGDDDIDADADAAAEDDQDFLLGENMQDHFRAPPTWNPNLPVSNQLYDTIASAGTAGMTSQAAQKSIFGKFWKRPMETILVNLTNDWEGSQPMHLRHLAIIRDTEQNELKKGSHYLYRTFENFASLVESGEFSWDAVSRPVSKKEKKTKKSLDESTVNKWGFPTLSPKKFVRGTGTATLRQAFDLIKLPVKNEIGKGRGLMDPDVMRAMGAPRLGRPPKSNQTHKEKDTERRINKLTDLVRRQARKLVEYEMWKEYNANPGLVPELLALTPDSKRIGSSKKRKLDSAVMDQEPSAKRQARGRKSRNEQCTSADTAIQMEQGGRRISPSVEMSVQMDRGVPANQRTASETSGEARVDQSVTVSGTDGQPPGSTQTPLISSGRNETLQDPQDTFPHSVDDSFPSVHSPKSPTALQKPMTTERKKKAVYKALVTEARIKEVAERILLKSKPAVYIDPIGSQKPAKHGRPRKATIAVFKTNQLVEFAWFKQESDDQNPKEQDRRRNEEIRDEALQRLTGKKPERRNVIVIGTPADSHDEEMISEERPSGQNRSGDAVTQAQPPGPEEREKVYRSPYPTLDKSFAQSPSVSTSQAEVSLPSSTPFLEPRKATRNSGIAHNEGKSRNSPRKPTRVVKLGQGSVSSKRTQLVMEIVRMAGGVYPTGGPIQPVYRNLWREKNPNQTSTTDNKTISDTVKGLVHNAKLVRLVFSFRKNGTTSHKGIVALPGFQPDSPEIRQLQLKIIEAYPDSYFPPEVRHLVPANYLDPTRRGAHIEQLAINRDVIVQRKHLFRKEAMEQDRLLNRTQKRVNETAIKKAQKKAEALKARQARIEERQKDAEILRRRQSHARHAETITRANMSRPQRMSYALKASSGPDTTSMRAGLADIYTLPINQNEEELKRLEKDLEEDDSDEDTSNVPNNSSTGSTRETVSLHGSIRFHSNLGELPVQQAMLPVVYKSRMCNFTDYVPQTDMESPLIFPRVLFSSTSGTFGTFYGPSIYIYDLRFLKDEASHSLWEANMPKDLEDVLARVSHHRVRGASKDHDPRKTKFFQAMERISLGETKDVNRGTYVVYTPEGMTPHNPHTPRLRIPRFINHTLPGKQTLAPYAGPLVVDDGSNNDVHIGEKFTLLWEHERSWVCTYPEMPPTEPEWETRALRESWERLRKRPRLADSPNERLRRPKRWANLVEALTREKGPPPKPRRRLAKDPSKRKRFGPRNNDFTIDATAMKRLLYAAVVVKVLAGGNRSTISWNLMHYIFRNHPNLDLMTLKNRLTWIDHHYNDMYQKLQDSFRDAFILAYERGELPQLDYGKLESYDWDYVVDWAQTNLHLPSDVGTRLPADRADLEKLYCLDEVPAGYLGRQKARYFRPDEMMKNRRLAAHSLPFAAPIYPTAHAHTQKTSRRNADIALGKSWLRANATTPAADYDKHAAMLKLGELDHSLLSNSVSMLVKDKVFVHRTKGKTLIPGRNYQFTNQFEKSIRSDVRADHLSGAVQYKKAMDQAFDRTKNRSIDAEGDIDMQGDMQASVDIPITINTSAVIVNLNLLATHRIRLHAHLPPFSADLPFDRPPGPAISKWGFTRGHYSTRRMPREAFHWPISAMPTATYTPGIMPVAPPPTSADSLTVTPSSVLKARSLALRTQPLIPLWRTLHDGVILHWWGRFVACVLHVLATRTGLTTRHIVDLLNGFIDVAEVEMVIRWLERVGAIRRLRSFDDTQIHEEQAKGPWVLLDGWWSVLGDDQSGEFAGNGAAWTRDRNANGLHSTEGSGSGAPDGVSRSSRLDTRFIPLGSEEMAIGMRR